MDNYNDDIIRALSAINDLKDVAECNNELNAAINSYDIDYKRHVLEKYIECENAYINACACLIGKQCAYPNVNYVGVDILDYFNYHLNECRNAVLLIKLAKQLNK